MAKTLKSEIIYSIYNKVPDEHELFVLTSAGLVSGFAINTDDALPASTRDMMKAIDYDFDKFIAEHDASEKNDGFIGLKDVTLHTSAPAVSIPFFPIFIDQIIGITSGKFE